MVADQSSARFPTKTRDHVDNACWETSFVGEFSQADNGPGSVLTWLDNQSVSGSQCWSQLGNGQR